MSHQGWIRSSASRLGRRSRGTSRRRRPFVDLGRSLGAEPLEVRALLSGQTVQLIKDVNNLELNVGELTPAGSNLFYTVADSTGAGSDLMVTNAEGTQSLPDTGSPMDTASPYGEGTYSSPFDLTAVGNSICFIETVTYTEPEETPPFNTAQEYQLWTSNGTAAGTAHVTPLEGVMPEIWGVLGNTLVFETEYGQPGLWTVNPDSTTPTLIASLSAQSSMIGLVGGTLYFSVNGDLWSTDGTAQNTQELFNPASSQPIPAPLDIFGYQGQVYYVDGSYDGSFTSTIGILNSGGETPVLTDLPAPISNPIVAGPFLCFTADEYEPVLGESVVALWASDGTQAGTGTVGDFTPNQRLESFVSVGGSLAFTALGADGDRQLWTSDGTSQGTSMVMDLGIPDAAGNVSGYQTVSVYGGGLLPVGDTLFFAADDGTHGGELWSDDVATGTTQLVDDIDPGPDSSDPRDIVAWNGQLYFAANDGTSPTTTQLWTSGGTAASTSLFASFSPGVTGSAVPNDWSGTPFGTLGSQILAPLIDGVHGPALWTTDGTEAGTQPLAAVRPLSFADLDGKAYFLGMEGPNTLNQGATLGLWATDGTAAGTSEVMDLTQYGSTGDESTYEPQMATSGSLLYFVTGDASGDLVLWTSNGTAAGTNLVWTLPAPGLDERDTISDMTPFDGKLAFLLNDSEVWVTDGTAGGTQLLNTDASVSVPYESEVQLAVLGNTLYFIGTDPAGPSGYALWSSDGTSGHTSVVFPFPTLADPAFPQSTATVQGGNLTAAGSRLFFSLIYDEPESVNTYEDQLWTSDGTAGGTVQVATPFSGPDSYLTGFMTLGNQVIFRTMSWDGTALWASDGTIAGTQELKILKATSGEGYPGAGYSANTVVDDGIIYFAAYDGTHGTELWESDGTAAGTFMVNDINPGSASSNPTPLAVINGQVVLEADDGVHGIELMGVVSTAQDSAPLLATVPKQEFYVGEDFELPMAFYASDPNQPALPLTYSLGSDAPAGMAIDPQTGLLTWAGSSVRTPGTISFTVTIEDDGTPQHSASETITIDVEPVKPPVLADMLPYEGLAAGQTLSLDLSSYVGDPNQPPFTLTYSLGADAPYGASITPDGLLTWVIPSDLASGYYTIPVVVADDAAQPQATDIPVNVFVSWGFASWFAAVPTKMAAPGQTVSLDLSQFTTDPNTPPLPISFALAGGPAGAAINSTTGLFTWATPSDQPAGPVTITFQVFDALNAANPAQASFTINFPVPPVVQPIPTQDGLDIDGDPFIIDVGDYASDPNLPPLPLTYSLAGDPPAGASIDARSGVLTWIVPAGQSAGMTAITVNVSDDQSPPVTTSAVVMFDLTNPATGYQSPPPLPPVTVTASPVVQVNVGQAMSLALSGLAHDPVQGAKLTYDLGPGAPTGVSIDPTTGLLTWDVPATQRIGTYPVTFIVTGSNTPSQIASETIDLTVVDTGPPLAVSTPTVSTKKGYSITLSFSEPVDPATASNPANYILTEAANKPGGKKKSPPPRVIKLIVGYDAATNQVTLKAAKKPKAGEVLTLTIVGSGAAGIAKLDGLQLAGDGAAGTNYVATIAGKRISHTAAVVKSTTAAPSGPLSMAPIPWSAP